MTDFVWVCIKLIISHLHNQHCFTCVKVTIVLQHYYAICKEICVVYATNCYLCCIAQCIYITKDLIILFRQMFKLQLATFIILHCPLSSLIIVWTTGKRNAPDAVIISYYSMLTCKVSFSLFPVYTIQLAVRLTESNAQPITI